MLNLDGPIRDLEPNHVPPNPYKPGAQSVLHRLPGGDNPQSVKVDIAHTYAIAGFGKDDLASSIIFLAVRCGIWGNAGFETQLELAWQSFKGWCVTNKKSTTILEFSKRELKISSFLCSHISIFSGRMGHERNSTCFKFQLTMNSSTFCGWFYPRLQDYPRGLGKGSDAAVVGAWLEHVLDNLSLDQCPASRWTSKVLESKYHPPKKMKSEY